MLDSRSSGLGLHPGQGHCVFHMTCLHPGVQNGGIPAKNYHPKVPDKFSWYWVLIRSYCTTGHYSHCSQQIIINLESCSRPCTVFWPETPQLSGTLRPIQGRVEIHILPVTSCSGKLETARWYPLRSNTDDNWLIVLSYTCSMNCLWCQTSACHSTFSFCEFSKLKQIFTKHLKC